ncbi:hypothetical protein CMV30_00595 [Nibricoccus aquaticus]|uniref:Glycosyltransferase 2-like domain-containing protein n=1 Tax=Nibricoccus aquaticus TaxID=2576891 RepID=A0A290QE27_9BACT|nr:hypothetical protein [Nibricoccus aquaticus]ATC62591.1 hypothetical protein CMV30_00595 [Nibricoccus aquaticus]
MILILTPTLGESRFLAETVASVESLRIAKRHVLVAPEPKVQSLRKQFAGCEVVADAGREGGLYGALNAGLQAAGHGWDCFTYINDDDVLGGDFQGIAKAHTRCAPRSISYGDVAMIDEDGKRHGLISVEKSSRRFVALLHAGINPVSQLGMVFGRDLVSECGGFRPEWRLCGDQEFWLRALKSGYSFNYFEGEVGCFRLRPGQLSADTARMQEEMRRVTLSHFPERPSALDIFSATWKFRLGNMPRRIRRMLATGFRSNAAMLSAGRSDTR